MEDDAAIARMCKEGLKGRFWEVVKTAKTAMPAEYNITYIVQYSKVQYSMLCYIVRYSTLYYIVQYSILYDMVQYIIVQYTNLYSAVQYSTLTLYNIVQHSKVISSSNSIVQCGIVCDTTYIYIYIHSVVQYSMVQYSMVQHTI